MNDEAFFSEARRSFHVRFSAGDRVRLLLTGRLHVHLIIRTDAPFVSARTFARTGLPHPGEDGP